jgi:hypothetical protein
MKIENNDLEKLRDLLQIYKKYHDKLYDIENSIQKIDETRENLIFELNSIKSAIELTTIEEANFKNYMIEKYGSFDIYSILNG